MEEVKNKSWVRFIDVVLMQTFEKMMQKKNYIDSVKNSSFEDSKYYQEAVEEYKELEKKFMECGRKLKLIEEMGNEYYIPKIKEFHEGFIYERMNGEKWEEAEFGVTDCFGTTAKGYENEFEEIYKGLRDVRVKFLDKKQIIKEGWSNQGIGGDWYYKDYPDMERKDNEYFINGEFHCYGSWELNYNFETKTLIISDCERQTVYNGFCKNINEFKDILENVKVVDPFYYSKKYIK